MANKATLVNNPTTDSPPLAPNKENINTITRLTCYLNEGGVLISQELKTLESCIKNYKKSLELVNQIYDVEALKL